MKHLFKSLAEFQQEVPVIHKGTQGYNYTYADLPKIFEVINPLLKKHGLGFTQVINSKYGKNYLGTVLFHVESGEQMESVTLIPSVQLDRMNDYQSFGSGITYFRRYCLSSILGLVTDKDTDAAGEQKTPKKEEKKVEEKEALSVAQFNKLIGMIMTGEQHPKLGVLTVEIAKDKWKLNEEQLLTLNDL
jgi:hypothetical protein